MPRKGFITPSQFSKLLVEDKGGKGFGAQAVDYAYELAAAFFDVEKEEQKSKSTEHGKVYEYEALRAYESLRFVELETMDFTVHPLHNFVGGTPDSRILDQPGLVDAKCPFNIVNHLRNLHTGYQIKDYRPQFQGYLWICDLEYLDMISYDPRYKGDFDFMKINVTREYRDDRFIKALEERVVRFYYELVYPLAYELKDLGLVQSNS